MSSTVLDSVSGLTDFALYFGLFVALLVVFKVVYTKVTPYDEWALIKDQQSSAAAVAFGGAIIGFSIALHSAISHSVSLLDSLAWALIALIAQLLAFTLIRLLFMPRIAERICNNEMAAGIVVASFSIGVGLINAASMSY